MLWAKSRETKIDLMSSMAKMIDGTQEDEAHKKKSRDQDGGNNNKVKEEPTPTLGVEQARLGFSQSRANS